MTDSTTSTTDASPSPSTATGRSGNAGTAASRGERRGPPITERLASLIERRGLDVERLTLQLGVTASEMLGGDAIAIPYLDDGQQVGRKHRTLDSKPKRFVQDKGSAQIFYNIDALRDDTLVDMPLVITEGEVDCWSALDAGLLRTVSVPGGAPPKEVEEPNAQKYQFVHQAEDAGLLAPERVRDIVLAVDDDVNGRHLQHDLLLRLGASRCRCVRYPDGCKDLNEVLVQLGRDAVRACIVTAEAAPIEGFFEFVDWLDPPYFPALTTGIEGMDAHYKPRVGELTVVTGIPGMGKSSLVVEISARMALLHHWRVVLAPFETTKSELQRDLRSFHSGMLQKHMLGDEIAEADDWINRHFAVIVPPLDREIDLPWFLLCASQAVLRFEAQLLVIDPWNEMDHVRPPEMSVTEYTGFAIKQLKRFAQKYRVHVVVVAHPAKMGRLKNGKVPVPMLYDIADSAHWANKPDVGIIVHRYDVRTSNTLLRIAKVRYRAVGRPGDLAGLWNQDTSRYAIGPIEEILGDDY